MILNKAYRVENIWYALFFYDFSALYGKMEKSITGICQYGIGGTIMKLSEEQRKIGIKYNIMQLLTVDIHNERYNELQKIYESLNLRSNTLLVNKLLVERNVSELFTHTVYMDALFVIADYLDSRPEIIDLVDILYAKRCPRIKNIFVDWEYQYKSAGIIKNAKSFKMALVESYYLNFLFYRSDVFEEPDQILKGFDFEQDKYMLNYSFYMTDKTNLIMPLYFALMEKKWKII